MCKAGITLDMSQWKSVHHYNTVYTVKPAHEVSSIKQSPVIIGHIFLVPHRKFY